MSKYSVVMIRHGESEWNQKNLFCGWFDSDLSDAGRAEAEAAGKALKGLSNFTTLSPHLLPHLVPQTVPHPVLHPVLYPVLHRLLNKNGI